METKFTKGQWKITRKTETFPISIIISSTIDDGINEPFDLDVCHVLPKIQGREANAKLISAAPDMYDVLNELIEIKNSYGITMPTDLAVRMLKALKKATE